MKGAERYWEGRWRDEYAENVKLTARIEALEAALREIMLQNVEPYCREIARAALAPETKE
jgi:hypothetical protein